MGRGEVKTLNMDVHVYFNIPFAFKSAYTSTFTIKQLWALFHVFFLFCFCKNRDILYRYNIKL